MPPKKRTKYTHIACGTGENVPAAPVAQGPLANMPLDMLFEIFSSLHPRDLLSLARTSTAFRAFLMNPKLASVFWENARKHVEGLPPLPAHLSEPEYANLVFFEHCHECLGTENVTAFWAARARYCDECVTGMEHTIECDALDEIEADFDLQDYQVVNMVQEPSGDRKLHRREVEEVQRTWSTLETKAEKARYVKERTAFVAQCEMFAAAIEKWEQWIERQQMARQAALRMKIQPAIIQRLRDEGWAAELDVMSQGDKAMLPRIEGFSEINELTDNGAYSHFWQTLGTQVRQFMEKVKTERLRKERAPMMRARLGYLKNALEQHQHANWDINAKDLVYIRLGDCLSMPEIWSIIEDTPEDATEEDFMGLFIDIFPRLMSRWVSERRIEYTPRLAEGVEDSGAVKAPEPLELAIASFSCCRYAHCCAWPENMRWTDISQHKCLYTTPKLYVDIFDQTSLPYSDRINIDCYDRAIAEGYIKYSSDAVSRREVIRACGGDPDTATYQEMEACGARLRCTLCAKLLQQETFDWKAAIRHDMRAHGKQAAVQDVEVDDSPITRSHWTRISEENAVTVRQLESAISDGTSTTKAREGEVRYRCTWCGHHGDEKSIILHHLHTDHSQANAQLDVDYYSDVRIQPSIIMYAEAMADLDKTARSDVASGRGFFVPLEQM